MLANIDNTQRGKVLRQALPYIQKYSGKIVVIKYGGNAMKNCHMKKAVMGDIVLLSTIGVKVVLVHGGGPEISQMLKKVGKDSRFVEGLRVTDKETMEIVQMVLAGKINKELVGIIDDLGGKAIGLSGMDGGLIRVKQMNEELGFVGEITEVNPKPITDLLEKGYIPVICTLGGDKQGNAYNINADTAAARIGTALEAESLISMTDVRGLLMNSRDESSLISQIGCSQAEALIQNGAIEGGMIPKVQCCVSAVRGGVRRVFIIDGCIPHSILIEMLTN